VDKEAAPAIEGNKGWGRVAARALRDKQRLYNGGRCHLFPSASPPPMTALSWVVLRRSKSVVGRAGSTPPSEKHIIGLRMSPRDRSLRELVLPKERDLFRYAWRHRELDLLY
jgi:hypothetical protein